MSSHSWWLRASRTSCSMALCSDLMEEWGCRARCKIVVQIFSIYVLHQANVRINGPISILVPPLSGRWICAYGIGFFEIWVSSVPTAQRSWDVSPTSSWIPQPCEIQKPNSPRSFRRRLCTQPLRSLSATLSYTILTSTLPSSFAMGKSLKWDHSSVPKVKHT